MAEAQFRRDPLWLGGFFPKYVGPGSFFVSAVTQTLSHGKCQPWSGSSLKKLGSSWIKTGEMEKKDATIYEAVPYPSRERGRLYHH